MIDPFVPRVGGILSADIAVPQHEREVRFYSSVLSTGEHPLWREDLMNNRGMPIIGLGARSAEHATLPLQWMPHIQVADVSVSVERALDCGGRELMHAQDEVEGSQWAVLLDPNEAAFGIIPVVSAEAVPRPESGSPDVAGPVGCISWVDLTVPDPSVICEFYRQVIGWSVQDPANNDASESHADFRMLGDDGRPAAGICEAHAPSPEAPSRWTIYLPVGDLAESVRRVREGGGNVISATRGTDGEYARAFVEDPVGACFALVPG